MDNKKEPSYQIFMQDKVFLDDLKNMVEVLIIYFYCKL